MNFDLSGLDSYLERTYPGNIGIEDDDAED